MLKYYRRISRQNGTFCRVNAIFHDDAIDLTVLEDTKAWKWNSNKESILEQALKQQKSFKDYYENLRKCFCNEPKEMTLDFQAGELNIQLVLKNNMKVEYFRVKLMPTYFPDTIYSLLDNIVKCNTELSNEINNINTQCTTVQNNCNLLQQKMDEFLIRKEKEDKSLINKFIAILNEKKQHIQHLNDILIAFRQGRPTINHSIAIKPQKRKNKTSYIKNKHKKMKTPQSSSESEEENREKNIQAYNTDEEKIEENFDFNLDDIDSMSPKPSTSRF
ncbi:hypothetical protein ABEB36_002062 [Hypothenemus hampei]|uniref:XRCC4 n=1 Tax=Hypothenemus hampei TaxID=57062 RepID=A0ABD1F4F5_HYPHA